MPQPIAVIRAARSPGREQVKRASSRSHPPTILARNGIPHLLWSATVEDRVGIDRAIPLQFWCTDLS
jgi:hypothetical protein